VPKIIFQGGTGGGGGFPLTYMGTWDANANVPVLVSGVGTQGFFYVVSVAGTTNLDGITDWYVGDWAVFDGTVWQQVDNSENPVLWNVRLLPGNGSINITDTVIEFTAAGTLALEVAPIRGRTLWLRRNYAGALYTINGSGRLIDGKATLDLAWDGQSICIIYDGAAWRIISAFRAPRPNHLIIVSPPGFPMAADYPNITAALAAAVAGDVVEVYSPQPFLYSEPYPLVVPTQVTLRGIGGAGPTSGYISVGRSNAFVGHIVTLNLESQIEGFRFNGMGTSQVGFLGNLSQRNLLKSCVVTNLDPVVGKAFSLTNNSTGNEIVDCRIGGSMRWGVWLSGGSQAIARQFGFDLFPMVTGLFAMFEQTSITDNLVVQDCYLSGFGLSVNRIFNNIGGGIGSLLQVSNVVVSGPAMFLNHQDGTTHLEACAAYGSSPVPIAMNGGVLRMRGCDIDLDSSTFTQFDTLDFDHGSTRTYLAGPALQRIGPDVETAFFAPGAPGPQPVVVPPISQFGPPRLYAKDLTGAASPANPITLNSGLELIDGLPFYQITTPRGWVILEPNTTNGLPYTWSVVSQFSGVVPSTTGAPITFGAGTVSDTTTTRYLYPGYDDDLAQTIAVQYRIPRPGALQKFRMRHNVVGADAGLIVYTVRINGAPTLLSVSLAANASDGSDLVNSVVVAAGDLVDIRVTKAVALALGGPGDIVGSVELL